jgi:hypothetical protein
MSDVYKLRDVEADDIVHYEDGCRIRETANYCGTGCRFIVEKLNWHLDIDFQIGSIQSYGVNGLEDLDLLNIIWHRLKSLDKIAKGCDEDLTKAVSNLGQTILAVKKLNWNNRLREASRES